MQTIGFMIDEKHKALMEDHSGLSYNFRQTLIKINYSKAICKDMYTYTNALWQILDHSKYTSLLT